MKNISLTGKWLVKSVYGNSYGKENEGKINLWEFDAIDIDGEFTGIANDISDISPKIEQTKIEGFIENNFLSFSRKYQHSHGITPDGTSVTIKDQPYQVNYAGAYNDFLDCFQGNWVVERPDKTYLGFGTFDMKRAE